MDYKELILKGISLDNLLAAEQMWNMMDCLAYVNLKPYAIIYFHTDQPSIKEIPRDRDAFCAEVKNLQKGATAQQFTFAVYLA